jgi:uncharacterized protein (DUF2141 family)
MPYSLSTGRIQAPLPKKRSAFGDRFTSAGAMQGLEMTVKATVCALLFFCLLLFAAGGIQAEDAPSGNISVVIKSLKNSRGLVRVALFGSKETYNNDHSVGMGAFRKTAVPILGNQATATFSDIPFGDYAVKVFHDENNSGKFLTDAFGRPKVEYGFSKDARSVFGPPNYEKAKFLLDRPSISLEINTRSKR